MRLNWPWRLHRELAERQLQGQRLEAEAAEAEAQSRARVEEMRQVAQPLQDKASRNQFAQLIMDCIAGAAYRKSGARWHGA